MSDPPKVIIKNKVTIVTDSDEENASGSNSRHHTPLRQRSLNRSTSRNSDNDSVEASDSRRRSRKSTRRSDANNAEIITLQETAKKSQPVTLKASFLRRKIKEYEDEDDATTSGHNIDESEKRVIFINQLQPQKYCNNHISTAKYSTLSFIPSFLFEQFRRYSNCFFLFIALLQQIPDVSPTGRYTTLVPLIFILTVSALKEIVEDFKRHRADDEINHRQIESLQNGGWANVMWKNLAVGDIVKVQNNDFFPADLVQLSSSEPQGISFIETSNLDGETNLKIRQGIPETSKIVEVKDLVQLQGTIDSEPPNRHLYEYSGNFKELNKQVLPLGPDQLLLRGAMLRNTSWIFGIVVYTGHDTKLMRNSTSAPLKRSTVDKLTNTQILMLFFILLVLCVTSAVFNEIWTVNFFENHWYLGIKDITKNFAYNLLTFIILYNNLIPISLQVTLELVRFLQAIFINLDIEMYHAESNTPAMARTSNLNEELGMVNYIFSDKTGTLTRNVMEFKRCSIAGIIYSLDDHPEGSNGGMSSTSFTTTDGPAPSRLSHNIHSKHPSAETAREFMTLMAICHTVIPENVAPARDDVDGITISQDEDLVYHAASPDERALVYGAKKFGFVFHTRTPAYVEMDALGSTERYEILNVLEFTSTRKRMSIIARNSRGEIKLYCKGADTVIYERLAPHGQEFKDITLKHLEDFANEGLRTLCFAYVDIPDDVYDQWKETYHKASTAIQNRERKVEDAASLIETNLVLLGATAIEDKLQDGVPETIAALLEAKIKLWVLTGDKQETAINIGYSCRLLQQGMDLIIMNEDSLDNTRTSITAHASSMSVATSSASSSSSSEGQMRKETALIIDGKTLKYALSCELRREFYELCVNCKAVICCRVSPIQKADCIMLVRECSKSKDLMNTKSDVVTLAIGDGANDVAMIQRAHVGVGISGVEGLQAACASDYSIAQFKYLRRLLLVHGAWNYSRMCKLILYSFYKNICLYVIELWFAIYSGWSGQILFERWTIGLYNVFFTALPPFAIGIFDKVYSAETLYRNPRLYEHFQSARLFNVKVFWIWIGNAMIHSMILYWMSMYSYFGDVVWSSGREGGYLVLGNMVYTYVVVTVCLKAGLITNSWTWLTHCSIWGSIGLWFLFMFGYSNIWPFVRVGAVFSGTHHMIFTSPVFWLGLILIPVTSLLIDVIVKVIQNRHKSSSFVQRSAHPKQEPKASTTIGKIKAFLGWNRDEYPVTVTAPVDESPLRPPRRKRTSRNSVAPSENSVVKVISPATPMHVNDIENNYSEKPKVETNHI